MGGGSKVSITTAGIGGSHAGVVAKGGGASGGGGWFGGDGGSNWSCGGADLGGGGGGGVVPPLEVSSPESTRSGMLVSSPESSWTIRKMVSLRRKRGWGASASVSVHCCDDSLPMRRRFLDCQGKVGGGALRRLVRTERGLRGSALGEGCLAGCFGEGKDAEGGVEVVVVGEGAIGVLRGTDLGGGELAEGR